MQRRTNGSTAAYSSIAGLCRWECGGSFSTSTPRPAGPVACSQPAFRGTRIPRMVRFSAGEGGPWMTRGEDVAVCEGRAVRGRRALRRRRRSFASRFWASVCSKMRTLLPKRERPPAPSLGENRGFWSTLSKNGPWTCERGGLSRSVGDRSEPRAVFADDSGSPRAFLSTRKP